ncbi:putative disease resistance RPP13-like protein 1 [Ziziphus jujuba]|uniref:Disease resistance RPP13-like protein 1 n=4 Tax=Ziziphus jujuba TaxID=326968 RepID=A0A6P4A0C1_ZIZJJ|nr:putative disease resistance RPP13-like protein 1 [Ziziphus jujuba]XP_015886580.3 putative disease resistance RPP13-like protein 1 [Ziziphus jujuba]XP_015886581.3 putative disease resistance RPP13-like protein 1 [Ziziphus jujuba]
MESIVLQSGLTAAFLEVVLDKFTNFAQKRFGLILGVDEKLKNLERTIVKIQALVDDSEIDQLSNNASGLWLLDLKSVLNDAEYLLDEIALELERWNYDDGRLSSTNHVRHMVSSSFQFSIPSQIQEMQRKLNALLGEMQSYFMMDVLKLRRAKVLNIKHSTSLVDESFTVGRDKDKEEILRLLSSGLVDGQTPSVISIEGIGGIGKTTLAQLVYNDDEIARNFDLRIWVSVSVQYDVLRITKSIFEYVTKKIMHFSDLNHIQIELQKTLLGKRFLLVLDNMWDESPSDWDILRLPFKVAAMGSKILVTTRSQRVSTVLGSRFAYHVQILSDEDCWELIKKIVLKNKSMQINQKLEIIGSKIAKKCKGLPLAAKMVGNVLCFKSGEQWEDMLKVELRDMAGNRNEIYPSLKVSYDDLSACLKRCFAYCSIFPYDFEFIEDDLVQIWIAEGFIKAGGTRNTEDVGRDYFDELLCKSFFQPSSSNTPTYKMHALVNDLAQLVSRDLCLRVEDTTSCLSPKCTSVCHLSLLCQNFRPSDLRTFYRYKSLSTFMSTSHIEEVPYDFFLNIRRLRVLNLSSTGMYELPDSIEKLKVLRYLNVSCTRIKKLPESVANLYALETLKLNNCFRLLRLPKYMKNLSKLRHLELDVKRQISCMPFGLGKLTNLQRLQAFIVGKNEGHRIEELQNMNKLCGSISITNLENVANYGEAKAAMLDNKKYLDKLELEWYTHETNRVQRYEEVLGGLQPHFGLRELQIKNYGGIMFPSWLSDASFCKLETIDIQNSLNCRILPALGQLPILKSIYIEKMHDLESIDSHFCGLHGVSFPCLESLTFQDMPNLQIWSGIGYNVMPQLRRLTVIDCPEFRTLPSLHWLASLKFLEINRCPMLQSFPDEGLPTSLENLIIMECDLLKLRCAVEEGEDWSKIKFIQSVEIDGEKVPTEGNGSYTI